MGNEVYSAVVAIGLGGVVGLALFVPFVALSYRRRGRLTLGRFLLWAAALVYFWAIWTYTLLPVPTIGEYTCAGVNLNPWAFVDDLRGARSVTDFAVLQLALNVLLFAPLGFFLRVLGGRGVVVALLVGFGTSLFIETTQLTGVWGIYPCAYRVFDVDDMLTNTTGAVVGSVLALLVPRRHWGRAVSDAGARPHPVTRARRLLGMLCDVLAAGIMGAVAGIAVQLWLEYVVGDHAAVLEGSASSVAAAVAPLLVLGVTVLATGRTLGDLAVELRYRGGRVPAALARSARFAGGIGGYLLLGLLPGGWSALQAVFAVAVVVLVLTRVGPRGLPGILSGQRLVDARDARDARDEREPGELTPEV